MRRCLICDDHALVRESLAGTVRMGWPDADVVEAGDFVSAWEAAAGLRPDVCIADLMMPGASPLAGIDGLMRASPHTAILIVTGTEDDALLLDLLDRGVAGFAPKTSNGAVLEAVLRLIDAGARYLPPRLAEIAACRIDTRAAPRAVDPGLQVTERLTERQMDVLRLLASGRSNKEIGRALQVAPSTVKTHVASVLAVLGAMNRTEAATRARALKLI